MEVKKTTYFFIKRLFDILLSLFGLVLSLIPMIIISIAIKLESKGPVFFKQVRTGKGGKNFNLYKFRSMTVDNDVMNFKTENKITKVGKFIRKTSLDELPQLFNILKGEMSFIGPRPWIPDYFELMNDKQRERTKVLPGITGLAQATGRNDLTVYEKIRLDVYYVDHISLLMDIKVIFGTVKTVFSKKGAELSKSGIQNELEELKHQHKATPLKAEV